MKSRFTLKCLAVIAGFSVSAGALLAQDSGPLIDLLVKKGVVSDQEAEVLRVELQKDFAVNSSAGKLNLSSSLSEFKLSGDIRMRHQIETQAPSTATGSSLVTNERVRERFRFRFNGDVLLQKGWGAGFALETGQAADSGNQTFGGAAGSGSGNDDYSIFLARAYVSYNPNLNWSFSAGKFKQPLYTTDLVWDADINPQGLTETYKYFIGSKDTFEIRALQNIMEDRNESTVGLLGRDAWLFAQQAVYTHYFGKDLLNSVILAPGFSKYNQANIGFSANENTFNGPTRGLSLVTFAGEVNLANVNGAGTAFKLYWDSAMNNDADVRVNEVYGLSKTRWKSDRSAWLAGVGYSYGTGKVQGDYSAKLDYRSIGLGSLDVNTSDSDFAFGFLNQAGYKLALSYNVTDFTNFNVTYFHTSDIQKNLTYSLAARDHTQLLQLDLVVKF
jgi:hypothetical protein